ncbi:hypothetical protein L1F30_16460 [Simiduia sp. 21SJ11W-1]|uniref:hypothetical protein n=1 Tax=Simiduia sp. 21SJ11W-1 TaxID=2909669 RepID=UPI00209F9A4E|nr:hypothetical protein [Simiduia sp. 21SJ11W-1]UTA47735.1 hypothetical protein L1F30_16460 [Simiduia sp. 21SJ11W-1]
MNNEAISWAARRRNKILNLLGWTALWLASFALATFGPEVFWEQPGFTVAVIVVNLLLGAGVVVANMQHLATVDELERKIALEAMAITLGVGFVAGFTYSLLKGAQLVSFAAGPHHLLVLMALVLLAAMVTAQRRHQ